MVGAMKKQRYYTCSWFVILLWMMRVVADGDGELGARRVPGAFYRLSWSCGCSLG